MVWHGWNNSLVLFILKTGYLLLISTTIKKVLHQVIPLLGKPELGWRNTEVGIWNGSSLPDLSRYLLITLVEKKERHSVMRD
ncbi:hypothetical protein ACH3XW_26970 [Acanthocheilonema viteae]